MSRSKPLPRSLLVAANIGWNGWARLRFALGRVVPANGSTYRAFSLSHSLAYIDRVFRDYLHYGAALGDTAVGKRILEIGPGDNLGVALRLAAAGASQIVAIDKSFSRQEGDKELRLYSALRQQLTAAERDSFDDAVDLRNGIRLNPGRVRYIFGHGIEEARAVLGGEPFDWIVSRAVLEELRDPDTVFAELDRLLRPGGRQIHRIDFRDYGMFSRYGLHPLEFLTVSDAIYSHALQFGRPNRRLIDYYRGKMRELGYGARFFVTRIVGENAELPPDIESPRPGIDYAGQALDRIGVIRPRLLPRYRALPDEDLLVAGAMLAARK